MLRDRSFWRTVRVLSLAAAVTGCQSKPVLITSEPAGARVIATPVRDGVKGTPRLLGPTPVKQTLNFAGGRRYLLDFSAPHFTEAQLEAAYTSKEQRDYHAQLERVSLDVELIDFQTRPADPGVELAPMRRVTVAYLDVVERSPTVRAVTRVTGNENRSAVIGRPVLSPTDDIMAYPWITVEPLEHRYTVRKGDTFQGIAAQFGVSDGELLAANPQITKPRKDPPPGSVLSVLTPQIYSSIWRQRVGSFAKTRVTDGRWLDLYPAFTPDGQHIIFSSARTSENPTLWRIRLDGGPGITRITDSQAADYQPSVAAGQLVAYASIPPGADALQIWTVHVSGALPSQLRQGHSPCLAPTGEQLLFLRRDQDSGHVQLWSMNVDGTNETQLTANESYDILDPQGSPDGKWIVYASNEGAQPHDMRGLDIWLMACDGTGKTRLTSNGSWDDCPVFDRTGRWIYFRSNRGGAWNIWRLEPILPEPDSASGE